MAAAEAATSDGVACGGPPLLRDQHTGGDGRCLRGGTAGEGGADDEDAAATEPREEEDEGGGGEGDGGCPGEASLRPFGRGPPSQISLRVRRGWTDGARSLRSVRGCSRLDEEVGRGRNMSLIRTVICPAEREAGAEGRKGAMPPLIHTRRGREEGRRPRARDRCPTDHEYGSAPVRRPWTDKLRRPLNPSRCCPADQDDILGQLLLFFRISLLISLIFRSTLLHPLDTWLWHKFRLL